MAKYSIEDTTLTNIADAIRNKYEKEYVYHETLIETKVSKTPNATGFDSFDGAYANNLVTTDTVTIEGANRIKVKIAYQTESTSYDYVQITANGTTGSVLGGSTLQTKEFEYDDTDTVSFYFKSDGSNGNYLGYYAEVTGYTVVKEEVKVPYTPLEMPAAIEAIMTNEGPSRYVSKFGTSSVTVPQIYNTYSDTATKSMMLCYENLSSTTSSSSHFLWYKKTKNDTWPMFYCKASNMTNNKPYRIVFYIWCSEGKTVEWANNNVYLNGNCQTTHNLKPVTEKPQLFVWDFNYVATSSSYEPTLHIYPSFANTDADTMLFVTPVLLFQTGGSASSYSTYPSAY